MNQKKNRFSVPAKIIELLYTDDSFFNDVIKLKKVSMSNKFPKSDEWRDENGFHLSFALAGYSPDDVIVEVEENVLIVRGIGLDSIEHSSLESTAQDFDDALLQKSQEAKTRVHIGNISRGIARRKFCTKHLISEEFSVEDAEAVMEYGLLNVFIPNKPVLKQKVIMIKDGRK